MLSEEKQAINRLKLLNRELYIDNCNLVNVNDLSTVLNLIAKLQKENKNKFYINKSVIEEKIEELKQKLNTDNNIRIYTLKDSYELQIAILQELLESSDENECKK